MSNSTREKEEALESLKKLGESRTRYYEAGYAIHELALKSQAIYQSEKATPEEQRLLLSYVFSNLTLNADKITPNYTSAFQFLVEWMPKVNKIFELAEMQINKRETGDFSPACPVVLRRQDSNLRPGD